MDGWVSNGEWRIFLFFVMRFSDAKGWRILGESVDGKGMVYGQELKKKVEVDSSNADGKVERNQGYTTCILDVHSPHSRSNVHLRSSRRSTWSAI